MSQGEGDDRWFGRPEVREWRNRVRAAYTANSLRYIRSKRPDLVASGRIRREVERVGRQGLELQLDEERFGARTLKHLIGVAKNREAIGRALDELLMEKPFRRITLTELRARSRKHTASFYGAFKSGVLGAYCHWATGQLDQVVELSRKQIKEDLEADRDVKDILRRWSEMVKGFVLERPHGRLSMVQFLLYEIDSIGASLIADTRGKHDVEVQRQNETIDEFVFLAAAFHRAGARLIHQLKLVFAESHDVFVSRNQPPPTSRDRDTADWNLAVSFWLTGLTSLLAVGLMEAEDEGKHLGPFVFESWFYGNIAVGSVKQPSAVLTRKRFRST
jgi:AcrR family transcriptional regulator